MKETIIHKKESEDYINEISGESEEINKVKELIVKYSIEEDPILILGETGVGKSHAAELIHKYSSMSGKFVIADTTIINENLFESEMFGHKKGAFTGAIVDKKGLVDEAKGGTLFIDEIAEVPFSFQAKLLRIIDTKKYRILGETTERKADMRIITATNKVLLKEIEKKEFREDLYYRLNVFQIEIPPLRKRKSDIRALVMERRKYLKGKKIGEEFWKVVCNYDWPGNCRELFTVLKRAGILLNSPIRGADIKSIIDESKNGILVRKNDGIESETDLILFTIIQYRREWL
jgi:transcriptional regulator with PAS, ATPase and Fis domain